MQAGSLVGEEIRLLTSTVLVSGVVRAHESWSIDRDIVGDLPDQVVAGGGIRQATGSVTWAEQPDVTATSANPWNTSAGWLPETGDIVQIVASDGVTSWNQFAGVIDETTGDVWGSPQSTIIDYTDYLNRTTQHSTVFRLHPPTREGQQVMGVGMGPAYVIDGALRSCGFVCTPRIESGVRVSIPGQTSLWPERGSLHDSGPIPTNYRTAWGWALGGFEAYYKPSGTSTRSDPVQLTVRVAEQHGGTFTLDAVYDTDYIRLRVNPARSVDALLNGTIVASLPAIGAETIVTLLVKNGVWTMKTPSATATGSMAIPAGSDMTFVNVIGNISTRVAGIQVSKPSVADEFAAISHVDGYFGDSQGLSGTMSVLRSYVSRPAIDLLTEISKATLAPFWFDESGVLQMVSSDVLIAKAPVQTVTTLDDITKLSWLDTRLSVRSKVIVNYQEPTVTISNYANVTFWQGNGETLESGQVTNFIMAEPADEDWAEIDNFTVSNAGGLTGFNRGRGTQVGSYLEDDAGAWTVSTGYATWSSLGSIGTEVKKLTVTAGTLPVGKSLVIGYPDPATNYNPRFNGVGAPILRGRGKAVWTDQSLSSSITGPSGFPELVHNAGPWLSQEGSTILQTRLADFIAEQVTAPSPVITGMEVIYDPRRQLGDVITISSEKLLGIELTALIVGVNNSAGSSFTQSLDVRIITKKSLYSTYAEYDKTMPDGLTYAQWQALGPLPETYEQFNDPA